MSLPGTDWTLQRKGPQDQARHQERVREAITENLADLITDESLIATDGRVIVKVPIRSLKEYRFRFNPYKEDHVGQGAGGTQPGDVLVWGREGKGQGAGAGQAPGVDYYEAEITLDEISDLLFSRLTLPYLREKGSEGLDAARRPAEVRRRGAMPNLDKRRTILENIKRNARHGAPRFEGVRDEDLRFRAHAVRRRPARSAVVVAMRDVSGSMGEFKKYMSRSFFFWMVRFLRSRYDDVSLVFIAHHLEAREVDEAAFFQLGESGGTRVSTAYQLALDIIRERFNPAEWNIYPIHFSDGDNWGDADNHRCLALVRELLSCCNLFGYGEINEGGYTSPLMSALADLEDPRFIPITMREKKDLLPALMRFFAPAPGEAYGHGG